MFAIGRVRVTNSIPEFPIGITRGPLSLGCFISMKAGKNMRRISTGVVAIISIIAVRFGIMKIF